MQAVFETKAASRKPSDATCIVCAGQKGNPVRHQITIRPQSRTHESALALFECEKRFDQLGESEVLRWLAPKARKQFPLHDRLRVAMPCAEIPLYSVYKGPDVGLNTERFAYFTLSIVWRRAVHDWTNFDGALMPPWNLGVFGEQLRQYLSGESEFP